MLQNPRKTLGFKKNMVYKVPPGGGGKPYPASGLYDKKEIKSDILIWCARRICYTVKKSTGFIPFDVSLSG